MSQTDGEWAERIAAATKTLFAKHGGIMHGPSFRELLAAELAEHRKAEFLKAVAFLRDAAKQIPPDFSETEDTKDAYYAGAIDAAEELERLTTGGK